MKIAVFTSNQPRHGSLIRSLAGIADEVFAVQEVNTVFPGRVEDFYRRSPVMQDYFSRVIEAERQVFGPVTASPANVRTLPIRFGDLNMLGESEPFVAEEVLSSDHVVVFGASWIKPPLVDALLQRRALNIHMGVSPYYRGSSCNFWCVRDGHPGFVGATIHVLSKGLDSGDILFHALPAAVEVDPFVIGMHAVRAAHQGLVDAIASGEVDRLEPLKQDRSAEIRYSRNAEFNDEVAADYLAHLPTPADVLRALDARDEAAFVRPRYR